MLLGLGGLATARDILVDFNNLRGVRIMMAAKLKLLSVVGALALSLSLVGETRASIHTFLSSWTQFPIVTGDATWNFVSLTNLSPTTVPLMFNETTTNGIDNLVLTIGDSSHLLRPGIYELKYSISVDPGEYLSSASLGVNLTGLFPAATVTKYLYTSPTYSPVPLTTLKSINGQSVNTSAIAGLKCLYVDEVISVTGGSILSLANNFESAVVPEPASLVVWTILGGGLAAVALCRDRRKAGLSRYSCQRKWDCPV